jgi:hypothetical protein
MAQVVNARGHHSHVDLPPTSTLWWQMIPAFIKVYWEYTVNGSNIPIGASKLGTGMSGFGREAPDTAPDTRRGEPETISQGRPPFRSIASGSCRVVQTAQKVSIEAAYSFGI